MVKNDNLDTTIVNSVTLGEILGISDRRVRQLAQEGIINAIKKGRYELIKSVQQYCNFIRQKAEVDCNKKGSKIDYDIEHALHEKIKREKAELQLKTMKGELHRAEDVEKVITDMIINAKTNLLSIPSKAAMSVMGFTDVTQVQEILNSHIEKALLELSEYNPELFHNKLVLQGDVDEGEEDD